MVSALAACGDNNTDPDKDNPGVSQSGENNDGGDKLNTKREEAVKQANKDNWQQVVKDNFGVTVTVPDGWTVDIAKYAAGGIKVTFECSSTETEALAFLDGLYDKRSGTKAKTQKTNIKFFKMIKEVKANENRL